MNTARLDHLTPSPTTPTDRWVSHAGSGNQRSSEPVAGPDLTAASVLLDATLRMHACTEPQTLLHVIATEALGMAPADGVVILVEGRNGPATVVRLPRTKEPDLALTTRCFRLKAARLPEPGHFPDLDRPRSIQTPSSDEDGRHWPERWRSVLVADLHYARANQPARLLWYAETADAFGRCADLAVLFAHHAGLALRNVSDRHHLERAVEGRTVTGQATGILMERYRLTAQRSFEVLKRCSQDRNLKLRDVAETLILTGNLPD